MNSFTLDEIYVGQKASVTKTITRGDIYAFAGLVDDYSPVHIDKAFGEQSPFGRCIAHGFLSGALFSTLATPENSPNIVDGVSSWFEITAPHEMTFNLDGEPLSGKTFRMELLPAALRCRLPPDCPLLR